MSDNSISISIIAFVIILCSNRQKRDSIHIHSLKNPIKPQNKDECALLSPILRCLTQMASVQSKCVVCVWRLLNKIIDKVSAETGYIMTQVWVKEPEAHFPSLYIGLSSPGLYRSASCSQFLMNETDNIVSRPILQSARVPVCCKPIFKLRIRIFALLYTKYGIYQ